eukprot:m.16440 g.16440  ORF g.16440 m.16440 type:complete len:51 (+) comp6900_c1_seq1:87-239(+)
MLFFLLFAFLVFGFSSAVPFVVAETWPLFVKVHGFFSSVFFIPLLHLWLC